MNKLISTLEIFGVACLVLLGCHTEAPDQALKNQQLTSHEGELILVGPIDRSGLQQEPYNLWFNDSYSNYTVDKATLEGVENELLDSEIRLFMATWCPDCQEQVPQFYKILDELGYDIAKLTVIGLDNHPDRYKTSPGGEEQGWDIESVPTFIFLKDGKELGRIVEFPEETLEKDMAKILSEG
jgi:thiol-disulfide isomerase/thioredoxin